MIPDDTIKTIEVIGNGVFRSICDVKEIVSISCNVDFSVVCIFF